MDEVRRGRELQQLVSQSCETWESLTRGSETLDAVHRLYSQALLLIGPQYVRFAAGSAKIPRGSDDAALSLVIYTDTLVVIGRSEPEHRLPSRCIVSSMPRSALRALSVVEAPITTNPPLSGEGGLTLDVQLAYERRDLSLPLEGATNAQRAALADLMPSLVVDLVGARTK